jgi:GH25 family lysozyme M1 (1,4-beta-N-acetylmuramidase)
MDPLICDLYEGDLNGRPDIAKLVAAGPPWHGIILKATEGTYYPARSATWFSNNWRLARSAAAYRYGVDWFRSAYHYLRIDQDPIAQANSFLYLVDKAGGWGDGDFVPMVDVEGTGNPVNATKQRVIDVVSAYAERILDAHGRRPGLYGGTYLVERGVTSNCGCQVLWFPRYTPSLPAWTYQRIGWRLSNQVPTLWGWQYCGDGDSRLAGYPKTSPMGPCDVTAVVVAGGGQSALDWTRAHCWRPPSP